MKKLVTISREYGSGGRIIGKLLAEKLDVPFYDKEIIEIAAKESGLLQGTDGGVGTKSEKQFRLQPFINVFFW